MIDKESSATKKLITILIPVYNEEENVKIAYETVTPIMEDIQDRYDYELLFTDNHSTDKTFEILQSLSKTDEHIRVLRFSKNFGYQCSILTGYSHACGDAVIQIDCDLQDPPGLIPKLIKNWEEGYQVVYGVRNKREGESFLKIVTAKIFYRLLDLLSEDYLPKDSGDFRLVDRKVVDALKEMDDLQPYVRGSIASIGFEQIGILYDRNPRIKGESKFKLKELLGIAIDGIVNHSIIPLRIATFIGLFVSAITFFMAGYYFFRKIFGADWPEGFAATTILLLFSLSINTLFLGVIGEYVGRIYKQVKRKPVTIIEETINI
jgi:polyisoprenyl-phosphate glycosyltransferase